MDDLSAEGAANFFNELGNQSQQTQQKKEQEEAAKKEKLVESSPHVADVMPHHDPNHMIQETVSMNGNWNEGHESLIKQNLLIGNLQYAAEIALKCGRTTAAFLIAERGGPDLFNDIK